MENAKINYINIIKDLKAELNSVLANVKGDASLEEQDPEAYEELKTIKAILVADEQYFVKKVDFNPNNIYVAVKFGSATTNFASSILSVTLRIMATENKIKPTQLIFGQFAFVYNLGFLNDDKDITQVWQTPVVSSNFNPTNKAFRTLFSMSGVLVIGQQTVDVESVTYVTDGGVEEEVALMSFEEGYQISPNPQPFGNSNGFAVTEVNFSTDTLTFSTYLLDTQLIADCMSARGLTLLDNNGSYSSTKKKNDYFTFKIKYTNGFGNNIEFYQKYKLFNFRIGKKIGDIPSFTASFSY